MSWWTFRDRQGNRIDQTRHAELYADLAYRRVAMDEVGAARIITIWHGAYPYGVDGSGPIFSSIIAREVEPHTTEYGDEEWYESEFEALAGHARRVAELRDEEKLATWIRGRHQ